MKVWIHLTKASKGMTLRNLDLDTALALRAALRELPGPCIDAVIVAENPHAMHAAHVGARRARCTTPRGLRSALTAHEIPVH